MAKLPNFAIDPEGGGESDFAKVEKQFENLLLHVNLSLSEREL
jgi:hypothetical protein